MRRCYQTIDWCCYSVLTKSFYLRARYSTNFNPNWLQSSPLLLDWKVNLPSNETLLCPWLSNCYPKANLFSTPLLLHILICISFWIFKWRWLLHRNILLKENKTRKQPYHFFVFLLSTPTPPPPYSSALNASSSALKPLFLLAYRITNPLLNFAYPKNKDYCFSAIYISRFYLLYWPVSLLHKVHFF